MSYNQRRLNTRIITICLIITLLASFIPHSPKAMAQQTHSSISETNTSAILSQQVAETSATNAEPTHPQLHTVTTDSDLVIQQVNPASVIVDDVTLTVSGSVKAQVKNNGTQPAGGSFTVTFFEDHNNNGTFETETDAILGTTDVTDVAAGALVNVQASVAGGVWFPGNLIYAFVDSEQDITELDETNNYSHSIIACEAFSSTFTPVLEWEWPGIIPYSHLYQVKMTPAVADLNGDGIPDIIFTFYKGTTTDADAIDGRLRAISGDGSGELFIAPAELNTGIDLDPNAHIAVGDIDQDGYLEIVAIHQGGKRVMVFGHDGTFKWWTPELNLHGGTNIRYQGGPSIADLNGDGRAEIIVGDIIIFHQESGSTYEIQTIRGRYGSASNNGVNPLSLVANLDMVGNPEIVAGNTAYRSDGSIYWRNTTLTDGYNAVGNFDTDAYPEIVLVTKGKVYLLEHDGTVKWGPVRILGEGIGGPPTVADVDGDGKLEIGVAGANYYVMFEDTGERKWTHAINDKSSGRAGSTAYDFSGDGSAEIVYRDQDTLYIFQGSNGSTIWSTASTSGTGTEMPIVVDVDADGIAEIVSVSNLNPNRNMSGVQIYGQGTSDWTLTRQIWNQHSYHITNVNDDGTIPTVEANNWETYNNYRQNVYTDGCPTRHPDLIASYVHETPNGSDIALTARIGNGGNLSVPTGVYVSFFDGDPRTGGDWLGTTQTTQSLDPGQYQDVTLVVPDTTTTDSAVWVVADAQSGLQGTYDESDEGNNFYRSRVYLFDNQSPVVQIAPLTGVTVGVELLLDATATDPDQLPVTPLVLSWAQVSGPSQVTFSDSSIEDPTVIFDQPGTYVLELTADDGELTASDSISVEVVWPDLNQATLDLSPAEAGPNYAGTEQTLTATLRDVNGIPIQGFSIVFKVSGPNASMGETITDAAGQATFTYTGTYAGSDLVWATASVDDTQIKSNYSLIRWVGGCGTLPFSEGFETGATDWTFSDLGYFQLVNGSSHSGDWSVGVELYPNPNAGSVSDAMELNIALSVCDSTNPKLTYWSQHTFQSFTYGYVQVRVDGTSNWTTLQTITDSSSPEWARQEIDLSAYVGQTIYLYFAIENVGPSTGDFPVANWYIDDINIDPGEPPAVNNLEGATLTLDPILAGPNITGTDQVMTATLLNRDDQPIADMPVVFSVTETHTITDSAVTDENGVATFTYTGTLDGYDEVKATVVNNEAQIESSVAYINWFTPSENVTVSPVYGQFFYTNSGPSGYNEFILSPGDVPVFTQTFPSVMFNPVKGMVAGNPYDDYCGGTFSYVFKDENWNYKGHIAAEGNGYQAAKNGNMYSFRSILTGQFVVQEAGPVKFEFHTDDGFIFGINNGATRIEGVWEWGVSTPEVETTYFNNFPVVGARNEMTGPTPPDYIYVNFPSPGIYPFEVDYAQAAQVRCTLTMRMIDDNDQPQGIPTIGTLLIEPEKIPNPKSVGENQSFTLTALDDSGAGMADLQVYLVIQGPNTQRLEGITDSAGQITFSYQGLNPGTDTIEAVAWFHGMSEYSATVKVSWVGNNSQSGAPLVVPGCIATPENRALVTGQAPITLASGWTIENGTIDLWPVSYPDSEHIQVLASDVSQTVAGATLATFDATLLANDSYVIRAQGCVNSKGESVDSGVMVTVTGDNKPGRVKFSVTDLVVPVAGLPIAIGRTYDSLERYYQGDFGYGWKLDVASPRIEIDPANNVTLAMPDGKRKTFFFTPYIPTVWFGFLMLPRYTPEPGEYGTLERVNGCDLLSVVGGSYICFPFGSYEPSQFKYTDPYGRVFTLDMENPDFQLTSIEDLNGDKLTFSHEGIQSSLDENLRVDFTWYDGKIASITDPADNIYTYSYAGNDLVAVTLPDTDDNLSNDNITYTYSSTFPHLFESSSDPRGNTVVTTEYDEQGRLIQTTVPNPEDNLNPFVTSYDYDLENNITLITNPDLTQTQVEYNGAGDVTRRVEDVEGLHLVTGYGFDDNRNLTQEIVDPSGLNLITTYEFDERGNKTRVTDASNRVVFQATYNQYGGPETIKGAVQSADPIQIIYDTTTFMPIGAADGIGYLGGYVWGEHGQPLTRLDANSKATTFTYDSYGHLETEVDAEGNSVTYTYDIMGNMTQQTVTGLGTTHFDYDELGRKETETDALGIVTHYTYDANGNLRKVEEAFGTPDQRDTIYVYDALNRQTDIYHPGIASPEHYTYDWRGKVLTYTSTEGSVTVYEYDNAGRLIRTISAYGTEDASETRYSYDAAGRKVSETNSLGGLIEYDYEDQTGVDQGNRVTKITRHPDTETAYITKYEYDAAGRLRQVTDANNHSTTYTYDDRDRQTVTTYFDATTDSITYDSAGNVLTRTDQNGKTTTYAYDGVGRLTSVRNPLNQQTQYTYYLWGGLQSIIDAEGHETYYTYDDLGRLETKHGPDNSFPEEFGYDAFGNMTSHQLPGGQSNTFVYDDMNWLTEEHFIDNRDVYYTYYDSGMRHTVSDSRGTTTYTYDALNRVDTITQPDDRAISYSYDAAGNVLTLTATSDLTSYTTTYTYDFLSQLRAVDRSDIGRIEYSYDGVGLLDYQDYYNNSQIVLHADYVYDALNRLTGITWQQGSSTILSFAYTLDNAGNRTQVSEQGQTIDWDYDDAYRLLSEIRTPTNGSAMTTSFTYDDVGNRLTMTDPTGTTTHYHYNELDQLLCTTSTALGDCASVAIDSYSYDDRGNLTQITGSTTATFAWDAQDRLTGVGTTATYEYDADGRRVSQTVNGTSTDFLWDEVSPYGDVMLETDTSGAVLANYVLAGTHLVAQNRGGAVSFFLADGQGSTRALADTSGNITDTYAYDAFGDLYTQTGTTVNPYLYTGQQFNAATGLYSLRARYYDPGVGRFLSRDTYECNTCNPKELNRYGYVAANPINKFDPSGYMAEYELNLAQAPLPIIPSGSTIGKSIVWILIFTLVALNARINTPPKFEPPNNKICDKMIKLLNQYKRLCDERGVKIAPRKLKELNALRKDGLITANDLPGTIKGEFPDIGRLGGFTLNAIKDWCGK